MWCNAARRHLWVPPTTAHSAQRSARGSWLPWPLRPGRSRTFVARLVPEHLDGVLIRLALDLGLPACALLPRGVDLRGAEPGVRAGSQVVRAGSSCRARRRMLLQPCQWPARAPGLSTCLLALLWARRGQRGQGWARAGRAGGGAHRAPGHQPRSPSTWEHSTVAVSRLRSSCCSPVAAAWQPTCMAFTTQHEHRTSSRGPKLGSQSALPQWMHASVANEHQAAPGEAGVAPGEGSAGGCFCSSCGPAPCCAMALRRAWGPGG